MKTQAEIRCVADVFHALRTLIPNIPEHDVERLVITLDGCDGIPRMELTLACRLSDGTLAVVDEGPEFVARHVPLHDQVVEKVRGLKVKTETKQFKIMPA